MTDSDSARSQRPDQVIAEYLAAEKSGNPPDRDELLAQHSDLADDLKSFFTDQDRMQVGVNPVTLPPRQADIALSKTTFWLLLLSHCVPGVVLFASLVGFVPRFAELFDSLRQRGELPALTVLLLLLYRYWYWLLLFGSALDFAVLYVLSRLPRRLRWLSIAWVGSVLAAIVVLCLLIIPGLLAPVLKMSNTL